MALCGALTLPAAAAASPLAKAHALVLVLYGLRLNTFLLYRELAIPRFRKFRETIEANTKKIGGRLARTPFVLGCSFLYGCMGAPLLLTAAAPATGPLRVLLAAEVGLMYLGFAVAAVGDTHKTVAKARRGEDSLVTGGVFSRLRHPNYTGELLLWGASAAAGLTSALTGATLPTLGVAASLGWGAAACTGFAGIAFVLLRAAAGLEKKQAEKYGGGDGLYEDWVAGSWAGPTL